MAIADVNDQIGATQICLMPDRLSVDTSWDSVDVDRYRPAEKIGGPFDSAIGGIQDPTLNGTRQAKSVAAKPAAQVGWRQIKDATKAGADFAGSWRLFGAANEQHRAAERQVNGSRTSGACQT